MVGVEISEERIAFAHLNGIQTASSSELEADGFDFLNADQVVEHLAAPVEALKAVVPALRRGGLARIGVPGFVHVGANLSEPDWAAPQGSRRSLSAVKPIEHLNCYTGDSLQALVVDAGLTPVRRALHRRVRFAPWWKGRIAARQVLSGWYRSATHCEPVLWARR